MKPLKTLFLKTYGKERRKLSAWISPENRNQAFDSTRSTDGDSSVFEPAKPTRKRERRTSVASRPAKKKAMLCLAERSCDEENAPSPSCLQPAQRSKTTRVKKTSVASGRAVRPSKGKALLCLMDTTGDEGNISSASPPLAQQSRTASGHLPSAGRFVTRRRRAATTKPKLPKSSNDTLNSSDDFTSRAFGSRRNVQPTRRRAPPEFLVSSAENSVNTAGAASFGTNPFREISLNELTDHSLGPCPKKPIFCSTPSAGSFSKRPRFKPTSYNDQSSSPPFMSVSCVGVLSTFQEDVDLPGQPGSPSLSSPPIRLRSEEKLRSCLGEREPGLHRHKDLSGDLFMEPTSSNKRRRCSEEDARTKHVSESPSVILLSTDGESSSRFVSAAAGLEWLTEALKERCLTERCTVQLERLDKLAVSQLCGKTAYSSCLGLSSSAEIPRSSEPSFRLHLSVSNSKIRDCIGSVNSLESSEHAASVTDGQRTNTSLSAEHLRTQESMEQSASVLYVKSTHHNNCSVEFIMDTHLPADKSISNSSVQTPSAVAVKGERLSKNCTVQLQKMALSHANMSENDHTHNSEDPEDIILSGEITERMTSTNTSGLVAQIWSNHPETGGKAAALATTLKEKCLTAKVLVEVKRVSPSQLKEILHFKDAALKSPTDAPGSAVSNQPESDASRCSKETSVYVAKRLSTSSREEIAEEEEAKSSCNVPRKGKKKTYPAAKEKKTRRSMSADRPGTTRKACVSGLSVSRWKNNGSTHAFRSRAADCSITELISTQHKPEWTGGAMSFSTPLKASRLNLSSLLADLTPNTHTWSRLKAALSVHRKVLLTPSSLRPAVPGTPRRAVLADVSQDLFATPFRTLFPKHLRPELLSTNSPVAREDADLSDAEKVCAECGQPRPLPWEECVLPQRMKECVKIGEGTFGEVFSTTNASGDTVALKIIPLEGSEKVNGEDQKTFGEILHEIIISKELSSLKEKQQNKTHGFIGLNDLHCVQGRYPPEFLNAWDTFDQQKGSENDRPDFFQTDQLFIILEFEFGGADLENSNGALASLVVAKSILHQVTAALAVAEQELQFEHRDLHWGNVLVKTTKQKMGSFFLNGTAHSLETKGVLVRIIDYSLSRLEIDGLTVSCDISNDEELFMGRGDYQFDIYRLMRQENGNNWSNYHPHTNVLWLHYLCSKLLSMKYRGKGGRGIKGMRKELTGFHDNVLQYGSATEALQTCPMFQ
ncbi:serine-rich adhesin for platelets [Cebidichthys violaceus]|uniref:serine-rich adhesin for platelets n=1 Tax=Cebidichthys violaceus TaxID=271503 RepID=UPI0035C97C69